MSPEPRDGGMQGGGEPAPGRPWYVQFWPVFLVVLMGISIAASLATVVIAHRHADEDVRFEAPPEVGRSR
jgi:hypothetical protein